MKLDNKTYDFIQQHKDADVRKLVLQHGKNTDIDIHFVATQINGYQRIKNKVPTFANIPNILYPVSLSLEQCSSESTARYKATLVQRGGTMVDLTGGFGIDCLFLSERFEQTHYVERNEELCHIASHNFEILAKNNITTHNTDSVQYLQNMTAVDCIFIDPARRSSKGGKIAQLDECEPNIVLLQDLFHEKAKETLIKLSPMIDITHTENQLKNTHAIYVVSVNNECKEVLFLLEKKASEPPKIHTINFTKTKIQEFIFSREEELNCEVSYAKTLKKYLYEPNASVLKAGAFKCLAAAYNFEKLDKHTHLYTSDELAENFCGRTFRITNEYTMQKSCLKEISTKIKQANISTRNFTKTPEQLRKILKLKDGGEQYLFGTSYTGSKSVILVCEKID